MVQRSLQRTGSKQNAKVNVSFANWPPALRSADTPKTMVFYKCFVKQFDDVIPGLQTFGTNHLDPDREFWINSIGGVNNIKIFVFGGETV